jgi:hypothetical protein
MSGITLSNINFCPTSYWIEFIRGPVLHRVLSPFHPKAGSLSSGHILSHVFAFSLQILFYALMPCAHTSLISDVQGHF